MSFSKKSRKIFAQVIAPVIIGGAGIVMLLIFLLRPLICGGPLVHHPEELARD